MNAKAMVEAALYSSAESLTITGISEKTGLPPEEIRTALMDLRREYDERDSALMISKVGPDYRMMLRPEYGESAGEIRQA